MTKSLSRQLTWSNIAVDNVDVRIKKSSLPGILINGSSLPDVLTHSESFSHFLSTNQGRRRDTVLTYSNVKVSYWAEDPIAKDFALRLFTCFYALFIVIVGVVLELSNLIAYGTEHLANFKDLIFAAYMYGCSVAVVGVCAWNVMREQVNIKKIRKNMAKQVAFHEEPEMLTNPSTGSLYLRLGCLAFGFAGVVQNVLAALECTFGWEVDASECCSSGIVISLMAALFIFSQMWFVYCNGKIAINGKSRYWISLGLMHLVATNVWVWIRSVMYEEAHTIREIRHTKFNHAASDVLQDFLAADLSSNRSVPLISESHVPELAHDCKGAQCLLGGFSEFMHTCVIEYSIICAGVAFVFWTNCGVDSYPKLRKRNILRIDCSRSAEGLFAGIIFLLCIILSIFLFNAFSADAYMAHIILLSTNISFFGVAIFVCSYAFWHMRVLAFNLAPAEEDESSRFLDSILLVVGLIGELVYCLGGIIAFANHSAIQALAVLLFVANVLRLIQVTIQSALIMIGSRLVLDTDNPKTIRYKPGKQVITLLLIVNLALFFMNVFEAQTTGVSEEVVQMYGGRSWALVVKACSPLTVFYRFHSSVCFAEIWKNTFKNSVSKCAYADSTSTFWGAGNCQAGFPSVCEFEPCAVGNKNY